VSDDPTTPAGRQPFIVGATIVAVVLAIIVAIAINNANGTTPTGAVTPPPVPTVQATPTPAPTLALPDCAKAKFGTVLPPIAPPADVHKYAKPPATTINPAKLYLVTLKTTRGDIGLCLDPKLAPITVNVIVTLVRNHYYDGIPFHRVGPSSSAPPVDQVGDPNCIGNPTAQTCGQGGPGFSFPDEPVRNSYVAGTVAMANAGPNTNGSQFFINNADDTSLPKSYNLFGVVASGMSVVTSIKQGDVITTATVQQQS
jgi:cyclophilin family peptidyl-prolyl cis-trans isomerase